LDFRKRLWQENDMETARDGVGQNLLERRRARSGGQGDTEHTHNHHETHLRVGFARFLCKASHCKGDVQTGANLTIYILGCCGLGFIAIKFASLCKRILQRRSSNRKAPDVSREVGF
jgi:hypothetical protein